MSCIFSEVTSDGVQDCRTLFLIVATLTQFYGVPVCIGWTRCKELHVITHVKTFIIKSFTMLFVLNRCAQAYSYSR